MLHILHISVFDFLFTGGLIFGVERVLTSALCEMQRCIHFAEDKTKSIFFATNKRLKNLPDLKIKRGDVEIKQHSNV
jgi:hypothetical protein